MSIEYTGTGNKRMYDRRTAAFGYYDAYLYDATFDDGYSFEVQVNQEFTKDQSDTHAEFYATEIGRMPTVIRSKAKTVWIHDGL